MPFESRNAIIDGDNDESSIQLPEILHFVSAVSWVKLAGSVLRLLSETLIVVRLVKVTILSGKEKILLKSIFND
ncbi:MAG: hypothetical protein WCP92_03380 [bacterium]